MSKKTSQKLSVKKETLRTLTSERLRAVAGGTLLEYNFALQPIAYQYPIYDYQAVESTNICAGILTGGGGRTDPQSCYYKCETW